LPRAGNEPLLATGWALLHLFELQLQSYPLTLYHMDGAALARCVVVIDDRGAAGTAVERMAARLLAAVSQPKAAACTKGRFFDRASDRLRELATFATTSWCRSMRRPWRWRSPTTSRRNRTAHCGLTGAEQPVGRRSCIASLPARTPVSRAPDRAARRIRAAFPVKVQSAASSVS
jgi:hypothetical protein